MKLFVGFLTIFLTILGAALGSFACCMVRRMRRWELGKGNLPRRSVCEHCGYRLRWFDNIPIVSYVRLRGRCRKCGKAIGGMELWAEVGMAAVFLLGSLFVQALPLAPGKVMGSYQTLGFLAGGSVSREAPEVGQGGVRAGGDGALGANGAKAGSDGAFEANGAKAGSTGALGAGREMRAERSFGGWGIGFRVGLGVALIVFMTLLLIAVLYDLAWRLIPTKILMGLIGWGGVVFIAKLPFTLQITNFYGIAVDLLTSVAILSGLYYILYKASRETIVGGGDWLLAMGLALALGHPMLAFLTLLFANVVGSLITFPLLKMKKDPHYQIPMAPFFGVGFILALVVAELPGVAMLFSVI